MKLLSRNEFYKRLGEALRQEREKHGLSREQLAEQLNQTPIDSERHLRHIAALSVIAEHIRRKKNLSLKQVAERANLSLEYVRDIEAGKIWNPEVYPLYCLAHGLHTSYPSFEKRVDTLSRTELDEHDRPVRRKEKRVLPQSRPHLRSDTENSIAASTTNNSNFELDSSNVEPSDGAGGL
jgi:transcriptional regulator with XRE-family HTH domain